LIHGRVSVAGLGLEGVEARLDDSLQQTDPSGVFAFRVPRDQEYFLRFSRAGYLLSPSSIAGIATRSREFQIEALEAGLSPAFPGCERVETADSKRLIGEQVVASCTLARSLAQTLTRKDFAEANRVQKKRLLNRIQSLTKSAFTQHAELPEFLLWCKGEPSCIELDASASVNSLRRSSGVLRSVLAQVEIKPAASDRQRSNLRKQKELQRKIRAWRESLKRFPRSTYLCLDR
jgi:hypothetical protein